MMWFRKKKSPDDDDIRDSGIPKFDDIIIEHTKERISQEFSNFSSIETKAGIILAAVAIIFTLILSPAEASDYTLAFAKSGYSGYVLLIGILGFTVSFGLAISLVAPRKKLDLLDPRKMNNSFIGLEIREIKRQIKHNLIQSFEDLAKERKRENFILTLSFGFMGIGALGLILIHFIAHPLS
jgi:hypothetical protein